MNEDSPLTLQALQEAPKSVYNLGQITEEQGVLITAAITALASAITALPTPQYTTGTWTPVLTFATPGNLSVTYSVQVGSYTKIGNMVRASFSIITSAFTHTTASGVLQVTGLPFASANVSNNYMVGGCWWGGITKAGYTQINPSLAANVSLLNFVASGSGVAADSVQVASVPSAGTVTLVGTITYQTTS